MHRKRPAARAWNLIRIAFLWARKRRVFRRRLIITELRLFPKLLKSLTFKHTNHPKAIAYREEQFSFDATPIINFKKLSRSSMRFKIPCFGRARVDYDYDFEYNFVKGNNEYDDEARKSFLKDYYEDEDYDDDNDNDNAKTDDDEEEDFVECEVFEEMALAYDNINDVEDEEEIDVKAESFIAQFYEEMKLQRQWSHARRNEILNKSIT